MFSLGQNVTHSNHGPGIIIGRSWAGIPRGTDPEKLPEMVEACKEAGITPESLTVRFDSGFVAGIPSEELFEG